MGRWRRWSLKGILVVLQSSIYLLHNFYAVLYVLSSHFPITRWVFQIPAIFRQRCPALSFTEILLLLGFIKSFQCPSLLAKNRRNRSLARSPLSNVRRLDSSLFTAMAEMLLSSPPPFICAVSVIEASVPPTYDFSPGSPRAQKQHCVSGSLMLALLVTVSDAPCPAASPAALVLVDAPFLLFRRSGCGSV